MTIRNAKGEVLVWCELTPIHSLVPRRDATHADLAEVGYYEADAAMQERIRWNMWAVEALRDAAESRCKELEAEVARMRDGGSNE